jgi:hypothetical protein
MLVSVTSPSDLVKALPVSLRVSRIGTPRDGRGSFREVLTDFVKSGAWVHSWTSVNVSIDRRDNR